ncbi:MAG TPA: hypothetical protein VF337_05505 [Candidatus Limnocylindrales bacterium]
MPNLQWRFVAKWTAAGLLVFSVIRFVWVFSAWSTTVGLEHDLYMSAASRWLATGSFYQPYQLSGPYAIHYAAIEGQGLSDPLFPPVVLLLLLPFTVLPPLVWWLVPVGVIIWSLWRLKPSPWGWLGLALVCLWPATWQEFLVGGPSMWVIAAGFLGTLYRWPSVFIFIKPTPALLPFGFFGADRRSWWIALLAFGLACLPFGWLWWDWIRAALINPTNGGLLYSATYIPIMCGPLVAWASSSRRGPKRPLVRKILRLDPLRGAPVRLPSPSPSPRDVPPT